MAEEEAYLQILRDLLANGHERQTRNSVTKSLFGNRILSFDLKKGFPLFTTKKMFLRGIFEELMFFIRGQTDTKILEEKGVNIWKGNTSRAFLDSVGLTSYAEGDMGPMYGYIWRHHSKPYGKSQGGVDQFQYVIDTMLNDPYSRRILMTTFNPAQVQEGCLYPCHSIVTQFYLKEDSTTPNVFYVSQQTYIRSNDIFLGNPYNVASAALLSILLCHHLTQIGGTKTYVPDQLHVVLGDYHLYESHYEVAKEQCQRKPFAFPTIKIIPKEVRTRMEDYQYEDVVLEGYECHPPLKAPMVP